MRILGGAGEGGMVRLAAGSLQRLADAVPSCAVGLSGTGEESVGQFTRPKANEPAQHSLLGGGCITVFGFERSQELNGGNVIPCAVFPRSRKAAGFLEAEIGLGDDQRTV